MTPFDVILIVIWVVCGIGGGAMFGSSCAEREPIGIVLGFLSMAFGIACGIAVLQ